MQKGERVVRHPGRECPSQTYSHNASKLAFGVARRKNLRNVFECRFRGPAPKVVLLMDDVVTTGTTLLRCAAACDAPVSAESTRRPSPAP